MLKLKKKDKILIIVTQLDDYKNKKSIFTHCMIDINNVTLFREMEEMIKLHFAAPIR